MVAHKLPGQTGEVGNHRSQTHRPGGKVDLVHVLGAAGIGLKSLEAAELAELLLGQVAQEILDGVVHRGAVGLDRDPVSKSQRVEIEGRHQADHGGATGLVAPHFGAGAVFPQGIGVVHDLHAQPQNPILNLLQDGGLGVRQVLGELQADLGLLAVAGEFWGMPGHPCTRSPEGRLLFADSVDCPDAIPRSRSVVGLQPLHALSDLLQDRWRRGALNGPPSPRSMSRNPPSWLAATTAE